MDVYEELSNIRNHGESVDNNRVKCKYCEKTMTTFSRLKYHLGAVGTDVTSCERVPEEVKELFRKTLLEKDASAKKSGGNSLACLPMKRDSPRNSNGVKRSKPGESHAAGSSSGNSDVMVSGVDVEATENKLEGDGRTSGVELEKSIGRFFFETGVDFSVASSPSFQKMISAAVGTSKLNCKIPTSQELRDRILMDEKAEMNDYIEKIRGSWARTGCSLLVDGWVGKSGRQFVSFIADCPKGAIYISSADVSNTVKNLDFLQGVLDEAIRQVGIANLVQIVASSSTGWMAALRDRFMQQCSSVIWSTSVSHCIQLMLDRISSLVSIRRALDGAKAITTFIYSHGDVLKFMKFLGGKDLVDQSWMEFAVPFFTLEKVTLEKEFLKKMFRSYQWQTSLWAGSNEGKRLADLLEDLSFWAAAKNAIDCTIPLLKVYDIVSQSEPFVGYIYETIDQAKETIKEELNGARLRYQPVWDVIDDVWNNHLHSILHGAAYYLNPVIYYSEDFNQDDEIFVGLLGCLVRMVPDKRVEILITSQLDKYRLRQGAFEEGSASKSLKDVTPVGWWSIYGNHCPELQSFAIRVLSQTCHGASRYKLDRTIAENFLANENPVERSRLTNLGALHYNLHLQNYMNSTSGKNQYGTNRLTGLTNSHSVAPTSCLQ